jgi:hypothetical protein
MIERHPAYPASERTMQPEYASRGRFPPRRLDARPRGYGGQDLKGVP